MNFDGWILPVQHAWALVCTIVPRAVETGKEKFTSIVFSSQEKSALTFHDVWGSFVLHSDQPDNFVESAAKTISGGQKAAR